ncbi:protein of unknown function [Rhodovastum atsumiense]|nr:protein of unknown function [Rhodovastum atsumiense]
MPCSVAIWRIQRSDITGIARLLQRGAKGGDLARLARRGQTQDAPGRSASARCGRGRNDREVPAGDVSGPGGRGSGLVGLGAGARLLLAPLQIGAERGCLAGAAGFLFGLRGGQAGGAGRWAGRSGFAHGRESGAGVVQVKRGRICVPVR